MNGVEILNQTNVYCKQGNMYVFGILLGIGIITGITIAILEWKDFGFNIRCISWTLIGFGIGLILGCIGYFNTIDTTDELSHVEYKVTVSDEVSFTDFMEKYEIIDQDDKIYTIRERE